MQTDFAPGLLERPAFAASEKILRSCVHCGFCTATCPTFLLFNEENDSPRGRIYLIKDMLEKGRPADAETVKHVDRCLSCLSCMTTCPSGVNYMHLVDHARVHIEETYKRPVMDRLIREMLALVLPRPALFRLALQGARLFKPLAPLFPKRFAALFAMAPARLPAASPSSQPALYPARGARRMRVALMTGCAQTVLDPAINEATIRVLTRHGVEVVVVPGAGCCGALPHHMGHAKSAHGLAGANIRAFINERDAHGLDHIVINTSGCGTTVKDYGFMFRDDPALAEDAAAVAGLAKDVSEVLSLLDIKPAGTAPRLRVAYHSACSLQHGQKVTLAPMVLLGDAGFDVVAVPEGHICCGSAGTYNLLQPEIAGELQARKVANILKTVPDVIAAGNIGCIMQIGGGTKLPIVHSVQLLDWATGGPAPEALRG
ncbi:MAG: glycolate oxidase subunit GlcF [Beijerinckiaceae bacterium]|nr:glycolate oxidase subunit GlcF [Beijerinckiaceae bacterium]